MKARSALNLAVAFVFAIFLTISMFAQPAEYLGHTQSNNSPFENFGGNHHYVGQLIKPTTDIWITSTTYEFKAVGWNLSVQGQIWQTDLGNSWVLKATSDESYINSDSLLTYQISWLYSNYTFNYTNPVRLIAGNSYFVGVVTGGGSNGLMRGDTTGSPGTGSDIDSGIGSPDCNYQESWGSPHNNDRTGAGTGYVTSYSIQYVTTYYWWHSVLAQSDRDDLIIARAMEDEDQVLEGVECKLWVQNVVAAASLGTVEVPLTADGSGDPDPNGYRWQTSDDVDGYNDSVTIANVERGMIIQMNLGSLPHTLIVTDVDETSFYFIDCNRHYMSEPNKVLTGQWTFSNFATQTSGLYTIYWML